MHSYECGGETYVTFKPEMREKRVLKIAHTMSLYTQAKKCKLFFSTFRHFVHNQLIPVFSSV